MKRTLLIGAIFGGLAVMIGAFGAHGLQKLLTAEKLVIFHTGVEYQFYHALGLLAIGLYGRDYVSGSLKLAARLMTFGILLFSFSLYLYVITGMKFYAMVTPVGGLLLIASWVAFVVAIARSKNN